MTMSVDLHAQVVQHRPGAAGIEIQLLARLVAHAVHEYVALNLVLRVLPSWCAHLWKHSQVKINPGKGGIKCMGEQ